MKWDFFYFAEHSILAWGGWSKAKAGDHKEKEWNQCKKKGIWKKGRNCVARKQCRKAQFMQRKKAV